MFIYTHEGVCLYNYCHIEYTRVLYGAHSWMRESVRLFFGEVWFGLLSLTSDV